MARIIVCGDSFCSADYNKPNTHFSELLDHEVINLARGGMSNTGICFQLQTAVELKPDGIIFSSTGSDRIDVPIKQFDSKLGLRNFIYPYRSDASSGSKYVGGIDANIMSDVIAAFLTPRPDLPKQLIKSTTIKEYIAYFHDENFKKILDNWLLGFWKYKLKELGIPYIHLYHGGNIGQAMYRYAEKYPNAETVYHTDTATQEEMAKELNEKINSLW